MAGRRQWKGLQQIVGISVSWLKDYVAMDDEKAE